MIEKKLRNLNKFREKYENNLLILTYFNNYGYFKKISREANDLSVHRLGRQCPVLPMRQKIQ